MITSAEAPDLTRLAGFAPRDLAQNELGVLSDRQRGVLHRRMWKDLLGIGISGAFIVHAFVAGAADLVSIVAGLMLVYLGYKLIVCAVCVRRGRVCCVEGLARLELVPDSDGPDRHYLHIGSMRLEVTKMVYLAMPSGGPYRVFYLEGASYVVGAAPLRGWHRRLVLESQPADSTVSCDVDSRNVT